MYIKLNDLKVFYEMMDIPTIITDHKLNQVFCNEAAVGHFMTEGFDPALAIEASPGAAELIQADKPAVLLRFEATSRAMAINVIPVGPYLVFQQSNAPGKIPEIKNIFNMVSDNLERIFSLLPTLVKFGSGDLLTMESFERIHRSCFAILRTIQNAEAITDIVSNCNLKNQTFDVSKALNDIAEACNESCYNLAEQVPVKFFGNTDKLYISCDKEKFTIAILNLIINSMIFSRDDNHISISCSAIGTKVLITVNDYGMGIAPEYIDEVLLPYTSKHPQEDEPGTPGVGIGLSLVREFVKRYGGTFNIESEPHEGTNVSITLPQAPPTGMVVARQPQRLFSSLISNRFSPLYVQLSRVCTLKWGETLFE